MQILVTGGNGLIGRAICRTLKAHSDLSVYAPSRRDFDLLEEDQRWDLVLDKKWDLLIHCAWVTAHGEFWQSTDNSLWHDSSVRLFQRFFEKSDRRIVSLGTCAEYDWNNIQGALSEDAPCNPETLYGQTKHQTYQSLRKLAQETGNSFLWPRIFFTFGLGESNKKLIPAMVQAEIQSQPMQCGPGNTVRDFCSFDDIGTSIAQLALSPCEGAVNIGNGQGISLQEIHQIVMQAVGHSGAVSFQDTNGSTNSSIIADVQKSQCFGAEINKTTTLQAIKDYVTHLGSGPINSAYSVCHEAFR